MKSSHWTALLVAIAAVALIVSLRDRGPQPPPAEVAWAEVVDPHGRIALPLPAGASAQWKAEGPEILRASGPGVEVSAYESQGPPVRALELYELAVQNATLRGDKLVDGQRREVEGGAQVDLQLRTGAGADARVIYLLRGQRYVQIRAEGPGAVAVVTGLRLL